MIAIVDYGLGNLESVKYALDRLGKDSALTSEPAEIAAAAGVILPGVGAFGVAMENLRRLGLIEPLRRTADEGRPLMGICLGLQLLLEESEEHGRHEGLGIIPGRVVRFEAGRTIPHMGWNEVRQEREDPLFEGVPDEAFFYFAHSYLTRPAEADAAVGSTDYDGRFASMLRRGSVVATQFHPEKSGPVGLRMLGNFAGLCGGGEAA
jgi:glutamine amidotransferase